MVVLMLVLGVLVIMEVGGWVVGMMRSCVRLVFLFPRPPSNSPFSPSFPYISLVIPFSLLYSPPHSFVPFPPFFGKAAPSPPPLHPNDYGRCTFKSRAIRWLEYIINSDHSSTGDY